LLRGKFDSVTMPTFAVDMPSCKAALWEIKSSLGNSNVPDQVIQQCIDAATDQMMQSRAGGSNTQRECSKRDLQRSGDSVTTDSTSTIGGKSLMSHAVIVGNFDCAYTMTSQSEATPNVGRT
jgi:hypothetical protein